MVPSSLTVVFLIAVNLIPLFGVLFLGWSLFSIMVLYWLENGIIGLFNFFKIGLSGGSAFGLPDSVPGGRAAAGSNPAAGLFGRMFSMFFFAIHYGIFWAVHGVFVFALFGGFDSQSSGSEWSGGMTAAAISLLLSHGASFVVNFLGKREYLAVSPQQQMMQPYARVVVLHVTILAGGFLVMVLGTPVAALVLLIILKTAIDVRAHLGEHRKAKQQLDEASVNETGHRGPRRRGDPSTSGDRRRRGSSQREGPWTILDHHSQVGIEEVPGWSLRAWRS